MDLINKYRPKKLKDFLGNEELKKELKNLLSTDKLPHTMLFFGDVGCGKTSLARVVAQHLKATPENIVEINAASNTGIDNICPLHQ